MRAQGTIRCPYCTLVAVQRQGRPLVPGYLVVCAGCAGPSRFDDAGERLVALGPGELTVEVAADVHELQETIRATFSERGHPPGHRWMAGMICRPCWDALWPERAPVAARGVEAEGCALCGEPTTSGIVRRILRPC